MSAVGIAQQLKHMQQSVLENANKMYVSDNIAELHTRSYTRGLPVLRRASYKANIMVARLAS